MDTFTQHQQEAGTNFLDHQYNIDFLGSLGRRFMSEEGKRKDFAKNSIVKASYIKYSETIEEPLPIDDWYEEENDEKGDELLFRHLVEKYLADDKAEWLSEGGEPEGEEVEFIGSRRKRDMRDRKDRLKQVAVRRKESFSKSRAPMGFSAFLAKKYAGYKIDPESGLVTERTKEQAEKFQKRAERQERIVARVQQMPATRRRIFNFYRRLGL